MSNTNNSKHHSYYFNFHIIFFPIFKMTLNLICALIWIMASLRLCVWEGGGGVGFKLWPTWKSSTDVSWTAVQSRSREHSVHNTHTFKSFTVRVSASRCPNINSSACINISRHRLISVIVQVKTVWRSSRQQWLLYPPVRFNSVHCLVAGDACFLCIHPVSFCIITAAHSDDDDDDDVVLWGHRHHWTQSHSPKRLEAKI